MIINKIDTVERDAVFEFIDTYRKVYDFAEIIPTSALRGNNSEEIIDAIFKYLTYGPMFYDEDTITDQPERAICAEIIREKALHALVLQIEKQFLTEEKDVEKPHVLCPFLPPKPDIKLNQGKGFRINFINNFSKCNFR